MADLIHTRSLVIIFSDLLQTSYDEEGVKKLFASLQHLKFNKHEVVIFNVTDKSKEIEFAFENRPYEFIDMETDQRVKLHPSAVKQAYLIKMQTYREQLHLQCMQYKIDLIDADINEGFVPVLQAYLIKRKKMG